MGALRRRPGRRWRRRGALRGVAALRKRYRSWCERGRGRRAAGLDHNDLHPWRTLLVPDLTRPEEVRFYDWETPLSHIRSPACSSPSVGRKTGWRVARCRDCCEFRTRPENVQRPRPRRTRRDARARLPRRQGRARPSLGSSGGAVRSRRARRSLRERAARLPALAPRGLLPRRRVTVTAAAVSFGN